MKNWLLWAALFAGLSMAMGEEQKVGFQRTLPEVLRDWQGWVLWEVDDLGSPRFFDQAERRIGVWPGSLRMEADDAGARFVLMAQVFGEGWVPLPGSREAWPQEVFAGGRPLVVVERDGVPRAKLGPGLHAISGRLRWAGLPLRVMVPPEVGVVSLSVRGMEVERPEREMTGWLWLGQDGPMREEPGHDQLEKRLNVLLEDGIPVWLRMRLELVVSGRARIENLGNFVPEGWRLAGVESPLPLSRDEAGNFRVQVKPGSWVVEISAFRQDGINEIRFGTPPVEDVLLALRPDVTFRTVELQDVVPVDVSQVRFPEDWAELVVYRWKASQPLRWVELSRGMGSRKPEGLNFEREWWLDERGQKVTFLDAITGSNQELWRLDVVPGVELGAVRAAGVRQLVTLHPESGLPGVEVRAREIDLQAVGEMPVGGALPATGWQAEGASVRVNLNLPPGWRLFGVWGPDWSDGDWLTAWNLLDLFLMLLLVVAAQRALGWSAAALAMVALAISYQEPGAPKLAWLFLIVPVALLRVAREGWARRVVRAGKWVAAVYLVILLAPFLARQIQQAIFPQLEVTRAAGGEFLRSSLEAEGVWSGFVATQIEENESRVEGLQGKAKPIRKAAEVAAGEVKNLAYDASARIQTGPAIPGWRWRQVSFGWNGPVRPEQTVSLILVPSVIERVLAALRVILLIGLSAWLLKGAPRISGGTVRAGLVALGLCLGFGGQAMAEMPSEQMLEKLRQRLMEAPDAFPRAAEMPTMTIGLKEGRLSISAEVHAAAEVAVPLPGRVPDWSPISVLLNGQPTAAVRREDASLWVVVPTGVSRLEATGMLAANVREWELAFRLIPRVLRVEAPGWEVRGVNRDGVPEDKVVLVRADGSDGIEQDGKSAGGAGVALTVAAVVERQIELGLDWRVRTTVRRLSGEGVPCSLRIPVLEGESVLSDGVVVDGGFVEVRWGASDLATSWRSQLEPREELSLATRAEDGWVEKWSLTVSPMWSVSFEGLEPVFDRASGVLQPVWRPWPGEWARIFVNRPKAAGGKTLTVQSVAHTVSPGRRNRSGVIEMVVECTLGQDFGIGLPPGSVVKGLLLNGQEQPVRRVNDRLVVALQPGESTLRVEWDEPSGMGLRTKIEPVKLEVEAANISTVVEMPAGRWLLATQGPAWGPAVQFWVVTASALVGGAVLGRLRYSPLGFGSWALLGLGLTQVSLAAALVVVGWLFFLMWRGSEHFRSLPARVFDGLQVLLVLATVLAVAFLMMAVGGGLLGKPEMFIAGSGSSPERLVWFSPGAMGELPGPVVYSVPLWVYRILMLGWALWLASALVGWLQWGWGQFVSGGAWRSWSRRTPPPLPK